MRSGSKPSKSSRRVSDASAPLSRRRRRSEERIAAAERGAWAPRWFWPTFAAPATIYLLVFFVFPFYVVLAVTFGGVDPILRLPVPAWNPSTWSPAVLQFTMSNIVHSDGLYYAAFINTFIFVAVATSLCLLIGYPFAYFLARRSGRFKGLFLILFFAPFWISYMLRMLAWISLLGEDGVINRFLMGIGILNQPYPFLAGNSFVLIFGLLYGYVPYMVLPLFATLDRIHPSLLEAGRDLGASPAKTFFRVTLPQSRQAILAGFVICGLPMFGDYYTQQLLAPVASTRMIGNAVVDELTQPIFVQRGAALILVLLVMLIPPILYYLRSTNRAATRGVGV
jgi:ABC-type spermidine/putrescine transport system permease subunit I